MGKEPLRFQADKVMHVSQSRQCVRCVGEGKLGTEMVAGARLPTECRRYLLSKQKLVLVSDKRSSLFSRGSQAASNDTSQSCC